jgi:hypothetical protein
MKVFPFIFAVLAAGCATAPGPKPPDEAHRVPVNRTVPAEVEGAGTTKQSMGTRPQSRPEAEVQWR